MSDRKRHGFVLLIVAGLIAASIVVMLTKTTELGLDLRGGVQLIYQAEPTPQTPKITQAALNRAVVIMQKRVDSLGVSQPEIDTASGSQIDVSLPAVHNVQRAETEVGTTARLFFYDWEANVLLPSGKTVASQLLSQNATALAMSQSAGSSGGTTLYAAVKLASRQPPAATSTTQTHHGPLYYAFGSPKSAACATMARLAKTKVTAGEQCYLAGGNGIASRADLTAALKGGIRLTDPGVTVLTVPQGYVVLEAPAASSSATQPDYGSDQTTYFTLKDNLALTGSDITNPQASTSSGGLPDVTFGFSDKGAQLFQNVTSKIAHRGASISIGSTHYFQHFATALDDQLLTIPQIDFTQYPDGIVESGGSNGAEIDGSFTTSEAQDLASELRLGALPVNLRLISENEVSATLGHSALHDGLIAGAIGFAVVILFLLLYYRLLGLIATTTLIVYAAYFYALIKLIPITMTLAGIAGLILTIGVAADANIVIFERVKEEIRGGRSVRAGIATGYRKGLSAIIDANVVTVMTAFILFVLATQQVQGFAFTLGVGTIVSLFTAVLATQAILMSAGDSKTLARPSALGAGKPRRSWRFDFMGMSKYFFTMSGVILLVGALAVGGRGLKLGIDFTSGTQITATMAKADTSAQVATVVKNAGVSNATIEKVGKAASKVFEISFKGGPKLSHAARNALESKLGAHGVNVTTVGPTFGAQVTHSAIIAIIASLLVISIYVALRFDSKFAVPTLIALAHDLLITAGVYALTGRQVTVDTVAALLTILGYSLYDTIIVFDRVRENVPRMPRAAFSQIVNRSMSEVITRSIATTTCTLLPIIALLIFGGSQLQDFAFALLIGVASGAYSSIFIASPVLTHWKEREPGYRRRRRHILEDYGVVAAYAGTNADVEPRRRARTTNLSGPEPGGISAEEFEELKRDIMEEEQETGRGRPSSLVRRSAHTDEETLAEDEHPAPRRPRTSGGQAGGSGTRARRPRPSQAGPGSGGAPGAGSGPGRGGVPGAGSGPGRGGAPGAGSGPGGAPGSGPRATPPPAEPTPPPTPGPEADQEPLDPSAPFEHAPDEAEDGGVMRDPKSSNPPKGSSRPRNRRHGRR